MEDLSGHLVVLFNAIALFVFPGFVLVHYLRGLNRFSRIISTFFISISFWICFTWIVSLLNLRAGAASVIIICVSSGYFLIKKYFDKKLNSESVTKFFKSMKPSLSDMVLLLFLGLYSYQFFFIALPPGNDTAMHGYITRLVVNNNGIPHTYDPILPGVHFGSYSAGYKVLTALVSGMEPAHLRYAINFCSLAVYPLTLLALIFFLNLFLNKDVSVYAGIIAFTTVNSLQGAIGWGGNSTVLAFALCVFASGLWLHAVLNRSAGMIFLVGLILAAIPLVHLLPAYSLVYLAIPGGLVVLYFYKHESIWIIIQSVFMLCIAGILLLPFILTFENSGSTTLSQMIFGWQQYMNNYSISKSLPASMIAILVEIKRRVGDLPVIISAVALIFLILKKRYTVAGITMTFVLLIYLIVLNSGYWVLPFSELLYPERTIYFMTVCIAVLAGYALEFGFNSKYTIIKGKVKPVYFVILALMIAGIQNGMKRFTGSLFNNPVQYNSYSDEAFKWIEDHTEKDAVIKVNYGGIGIWTPTFTNRATIGTHLHFIHEIDSVPARMDASDTPKYIFITEADRKTGAEILNTTQSKAVVFQNKEITVYH